MFRILIVDDERIVLNGIRMMIEEEMGFDFPMEVVIASNVPQAISVLDSFSPDLILTDIRMPVLNGFELIRHVRNENLSASIVILTSHADFKYAQQAIRFNVSDFILKPIDQQELKEIIERVWQEKQKCEQVRLQTAILDIRNMMFYDLTVQELLSEPEVIELLFPHMYYSVVVVEMWGAGDIYTETLKEILLKAYDECYCFWLEEKNQLVAICNHKQFRVRNADVKKDFMNETGCKNFWLGISISATTYKYLHGLYMNAIQRIFYARYFETGSELADISLLSYEDSVQVFNEKEDAVFLELISGYVTKMRAASASLETPELLWRSYMSNIYLYLKNNGLAVDEDMINEPCPVGSYEALPAEIALWTRRMRKSIQKKSENYGNPELMKRMLQYIEQHYKEDIALEDLASLVGFHSNYVSAIFKKETGKSYLAFLHETRLAAAKKLLLETDRTVEWIAAEVGYRSASQFARIFRKYEGVAPMVYRKVGG